MKILTKDCFLVLLDMLWAITMEAMGHIHLKDMDIHHKGTGTRLLAILLTVDTRQQDILLHQGHTRHLHILLQVIHPPTTRVHQPHIMGMADLI